LIVEDSIEEALLIKIALAKAFPDVPITLASDGDQGLKCIQENVYILAVIDLNLPGTDGIEIIKVADTLRPGMPLIAVTGYTRQEYLDAAFRAGASAVLNKPLDLPEFTRIAEGLAKVDKPDPQKSGPTVLAVGGRAGDVEAGCGGILLKHHGQGHNVIVAIAGESGPSAGTADSVASLYGGRVVFHPTPSALVSLGETTRWIEELVKEEGPLIMYVPSAKDKDISRLTTHQAALVGGEAIPKVLAYQSPGSTIEFAPKVFVDIGPFLTEKLALARGFDGYDLENLDPAVISATARYWGRFAGPEVVEPLEIIRG